MIALAVGAAVAIGWVLTPASGRGSRRLARILSVVAAPDDITDTLGEHRLSPARLAAAAFALFGCGLFIGGLTGTVIGAVAAGAVAFLRPAAKAPTAEPDEVAVVVDLLAGCLDAGVELPDALDAAVRAAGPFLGDSCRAVATGLRSGAPPIEVWRRWLDDPSLAPVARMAIRAGSSGAATAADLRRTATRLRSRRRAAAQDRVRRASVWLVAPLGLCFLPAFVLVAVAPLVLGLLPTLR
jgi:pilus assembly protein TadC